MKFLWVVYGSEKYGVLTAIRNMLRGLAGRGFDVRVVSLTDGSGAESLRQDGFAVDSLSLKTKEGAKGRGIGKLSSLFNSFFSLPIATIALCRYIKKLAPDAVHATSPGIIPHCALACSLAKARFVWEMANIIGDGYLFSTNKRIYRFLCRISKCQVLANSQYTANTLRSEKVIPEVFYLGVDENKFYPDTRTRSDLRYKLGFEESDFVLGIFARLVPQKGQLHAIHLVADLREAYPNLKLLLLGGPTLGSFYDSVCQAINDGGLADRVLLLDQVSDVENYYRAIDLYLSFSVESEGFGLSVVESMMSGTPVLAHALGGPLETVIDGVTGWHVEDMGRASLESKLRQILQIPHLSNFEANAREHALSCFTCEGQVDRYLEILSVESVVKQ